MLQFISENNFPTYTALSSDISGSAITGASLVGKTVYMTDTHLWYLIGSDLKLISFSYPVLPVFGNSDGNTTFEADGTLVMSGSATVWTDIFFPLTTAKQGQTDKPPFSATEVAYLFPQNDTTHVMYLIGQFPHSRKKGSDIDPHVHWNQNKSGSVVFKLDYKWFPIGGSIPATWETHVMNDPVITYTSGSVHQLSHGTMISGSMVNDSAPAGVSTVMLMKLYRDDDTYDGSAITYQMDIHYEMDTLGSRQEFIK